jgi:hypothetical protein
MRKLKNRAVVSGAILKNVQKSLACGRLNDRSSLSGQAFAAFGATISEHPTSTNRRHALTKAVAALTNEFAWLIRAFHETSP